MNPLTKTDHRPWPVPKRPWIMEQVWRDLLFTHWPVLPGLLRSRVPESLELDTFDGQAWISITPFHMSVRLRGLPVLPGMAVIPELNCRTYVVAEGKPGIYFFSLDTASRAAVWGARLLYLLPYFKADMQIERHAESISYHSRRGQAYWHVEYAPKSAVRRAAPGSLEHWLTERYCLYTVSNSATYRAEIHHFPWPLQEAWVRIHENNITLPTLGVELSGLPACVSFTQELKVLIWFLERIAL